MKNLNFEFIREKKNGQLLSVKKIYETDVLKVEEDNVALSTSFLRYLHNSEFKRYLLDSIEYSIYEFDRLFDRELWQDGFVLYRKYTRKDVFRILNTSENPVAQNVGGYMVSPDNSNCPIFVNYNKEDHISESIKYEDVFINNRVFDWMSKSNRTLKSKDVQSILGNNGPIRLLLFIKKNNDEGLEFYYMGDISPDLEQVQQTTISNDQGNQLPVVKFRFLLKSPVPSSLYNYLHENLKNIKSIIKSEGKVISLSQNLKSEKELRNPIPLYNFYAAAGTFSDIQSDQNYTLIEGPEKKSNVDYFACRVFGESMNRIIPNGSICLFKQYSGGSRNGKILLIENRDIQDPDFNSAFTIKTYFSEKITTDESFEHLSIVLRPNSFDRSYKEIIITNENAEEMKVIGEFVKVLRVNQE